jgi:hypothetical protein
MNYSLNLGHHFRRKLHVIPPVVEKKWNRVLQISYKLRWLNLWDHYKNTRLLWMEKECIRKLSSYGLFGIMQWQWMHRKDVLKSLLFKAALCTWLELERLSFIGFGSVGRSTTCGHGIHLFLIMWLHTWTFKPFLRGPVLGDAYRLPLWVVTRLPKIVRLKIK